MRLVTRSGALRELVDSLVRSARNVVHVLVWLFSVYVIFAVVGNALFGGRFLHMMRMLMSVGLFGLALSLFCNMIGLF